jgi:phage antirepressor YoqD-like protein
MQNSTNVMNSPDILKLSIEMIDLFKKTADLKNEINELKKEISEIKSQKQNINIYKNIKDSITITQMSQILKADKILFIEWLRNNNYLKRGNAKRNLNLPYRKYRHFFLVRSYYKNDKIVKQTLFTPEGVRYFIQLKMDGLMQENFYTD